MFTAITDEWFRLHGVQAVVYGCVLDENLKAKHVRAVNQEQRNAMRGSKYVGSDMSGVIHIVLDDLQSGLWVAFSGTPCQIAGLKAVVAAKNAAKDRLLTIEVLCHGVGSVKFINDYIHEKEKHYHSKAVSCSFRGKRRAGKIQQMTVDFSNGMTYESPSLKYDGFYTGYLRNYVMRPSCFSCMFICRERGADISVADNWGYSEKGKKYGSFLVVNTKKGESIILQTVDAEFYEIHSVPNRIQPMTSSIKKPDDYEAFWNAYRSGGYTQAQKYLGNGTFWGKIKSAAAHVVYRLYILEIFRAMCKRMKKNRGHE